MPAKRNDSVVMEGVRIVFRNFSGRPGPYNREGRRTFAVLLDDKTAKAMARDGWTIKTLKPREIDEDGEEQPFLEVVVNFESNNPPRVVMVTSRGRTFLGEGEVSVLDWADIENVDLIVNPYSWNINGKAGIKAYLQSVYVTVHEDELELKYGGMDLVANTHPVRAEQ